jgi:transcriptional regulator with XRE-family HTH domain
MTSRCRSRKLFLDAPDFSPQRVRHLAGGALAKGDSADVRRLTAQRPSNTAENSRLHRDFEKLFVQRGIFEGHNLAGLNLALNNMCCNNERVLVSSPKSERTQPEQQGPQWPSHILKFMKGLGVSQAGFAAKLNVTQQAVNNWIKGKREPAAEMYYRMARLAPALPEADLLITRARVISKAIFPPLNQESARPAADLRNAVEIPLIRMPSPELSDVERVLVFPDFFFNNAVGKVVCFRAMDDAMSPLVESGCIFGVDLAQHDVTRMRNEMVAACDRSGAITVRWLKRSGAKAHLTSQNATRAYTPIMLSADGTSIEGWKVVGKVLWWIGMAL